METKHTPGPWTMRRNRGQFQSHAINAPSGMTVANVWAGSDTPDFANARLIAAAPELLAERDRLRSENAERAELLTECRTILNNVVTHTWHRGTLTLEIEDRLRMDSLVKRLDAALSKSRAKEQP